MCSRRWLPPPAVPELNPIANAAGDAIYTVSWKPAARATSYTLEEDDNVNFTSPTTLYAGTGASWNATCSPAGTHYYRVRANNGIGSSGWSNIQSTVVQNVIRNPGFECGTTNWQQSSTHGWPVIIDSGFPKGVFPYGGSWAAWEGGDYDDVSYVQQTVSVSSPYLVYWHWIGSEDSCGFDFAKVMVNGNVVNQYDLCIDSSTNGWAKHVVNLGAYVGQTVNLQIRTETDSSANSNLFVDDISLQPTAAAAAAVTRVESAALDAELKSTQSAPRPGASARWPTGARVPTHPAIRAVMLP